MLLVRYVAALHKYIALAVVAMAASVQSVAQTSLPDLIVRIKPSIVAIGTFSRTRSPAFAMRGTGFAVGNGNLIATNAHVLPESLDAASNEVIVVRLPAAEGDGMQRTAKIVRADRQHDLALLQIEGTPLPAIPLHSGTAREGQELAFIGFPIGAVLGLSPVTHRAIVSAITPIALPGASAQQLNERVIKRLKSGTFDIYQLDGTAYPGNSGGPLFDVESGSVVGIINMVFVKGTKEAVLSQPSGISFAIPVVYLRELLQSSR